MYYIICIQKFISNSKISVNNGSLLASKYRFDKQSCQKKKKDVFNESLQKLKINI